MTSVDESPRPAPAHEGELVDGRFELVTLVKAGNGIDTYRGLDRLQGTEVVVKAIDTGSMPTAVYLRLQHETRLLERIDLGASRRVVWCGQRGRHFYVVQPRVLGEPLDQMLARGPIDVAASLRLAVGILTTLQGRASARSGPP